MRAVNQANCLDRLCCHNFGQKWSSTDTDLILSSIGPAAITHTPTVEGTVPFHPVTEWRSVFSTASMTYQ